MNDMTYSMKQLLMLSIVFMTNSVKAQTDINIPDGEYEITADIVLPNVQENLTSAKTTHIRCLHQQQASDLFPLLEHPSFTGCSLRKGSLRKQAAAKINDYNFQLICINNDAATGTANFLVEEKQFSAQLNIKMGAKNMTMTQNLKAKKIATCHKQ